MSSTSSKTQSIGPKQFPWKLHEMLETSEKNGEDHIVSWMPDGRSFRVHDRDLFVDGMMKVFFNQTKYKSFQRQLNLWGFERISNRDPNEKGAYYHPLFLKGRRDLCPCMTRQKTAQVQGPTKSAEAPAKSGAAVPSSKEAAPLASAGQTTNAQAMLATRNMSNAELIAMVTGASQASATASQSVVPSAAKDLLGLQQALRNQLPEQPLSMLSQSPSEQLALLLRRGLDVQPPVQASPDLHLVAAMLARKREQEAEFAAILALAANRSAHSLNWA